MKKALTILAALFILFLPTANAVFPPPTFHFSCVEVSDFDLEVTVYVGPQLEYFKYYLQHIFSDGYVSRLVKNLFQISHTFADVNSLSYPMDVMVETFSDGNSTPITQGNGGTVPCPTDYCGDVCCTSEQMCCDGVCRETGKCCDGGTAQCPTDCCGDVCCTSEQMCCDVRTGVKA